MRYSVAGWIGQVIEKVARKEIDGFFAHFGVIWIN
jgi:hypothetical protein